MMVPVPNMYLLLPIYITWVICVRTLIVNIKTENILVQIKPKCNVLKFYINKYICKPQFWACDNFKKVKM